jgi:hypothetical protein
MAVGDTVGAHRAFTQQTAAGISRTDSAEMRQLMVMIPPADEGGPVS